ncbi:hypothetical protein DFJ73DRAFT_965626 [Zopfochytrium polystomum]|nr:hypothetical protein DFJ73DRAFT_965626 [Zopfochytrium polystomum]
MPPPAAIAAATVTASRRHSRRRFPAASAAVSTAVRLLLLLAAMPALFPSQAAGWGDEGPSKTGTTENVGGVSVQIGEKVAKQGKFGTVYHAKLGSEDVIYKEPQPKKHFWANEVEATQAAGHLISAEKNKMVQKKIGTAGLDDWLQTQKDSPATKAKYLLTGEKPEDHPHKAKLSDEIYGQVVQNQKNVGYVHYDTNAGNIRAHSSPSDKPVKFVVGDGSVPKMELIDWGIVRKISDKYTVEGRKDRDQYNIREACSTHGFQFRADRALFRRAGSAAACAKASKAGADAAVLKAKKNGGRTIGRARGSKEAAARSAANPAAAKAKSASGGGGGAGRKII